MSVQPSPKPTIAVYAGSFDPVTLGHIDIAKRAAADYDRLIVSVGHNAGKAPMFSVEDRQAMLREALAPHAEVRVESFEGAVARYARQRGAQTMVRGVRNWKDRISETIMMVVNFFVGWGLPTRFYQASPALLGVSSSQARQRASLGLSVSDCVPENVADILRARQTA